VTFSDDFGEQRCPQRYCSSADEFEDIEQQKCVETFLEIGRKLRARLLLCNITIARSFGPFCISEMRIDLQQTGKIVMNLEHRLLSTGS